MSCAENSCCNSPPHLTQTDEANPHEMYSQNTPLPQRCARTNIQPSYFLQKAEAQNRCGTHGTILSLHAYDLTQRVNHFDQVRLCRHDRLDWLVCTRRFVDHIRILPAFDAFGHPNVIFERKAAFRFSPRHGSSCAMTAAIKAFRIAFAA